MKDKLEKSHPGSGNRRKTTLMSNLIGSKKNRSLTDVSSSDVNTRNNSGQYDLYYVLFIYIL
jgi:hypothetical protein